MLITIDTEEALKFSLSIQDCAVLDVIRRLLAADGGATEAEGSRNFKWLSNSTILRHLQCSSFRSPRQLHNIINKLCAVGLLIKKMWYGKPYYSAILRKKATTAAPRQNRAAAPSVAAARSAAAPAVAPSIPGTSIPSALHADTPPEPTDDEIKAALADLDRKTQDHDKREAYRRAHAPQNDLIPTAAAVNAYAQQNNMQDFDTDGFIHYNSERNWQALRRNSWQKLAHMWYEQQCKKMSELITYAKYCEITCKDHAAAKIWTFHHQDPKTGVAYFARANSTPTDPPPQNQSGRPSGQPPRDTQQKSVL